MSSKKPLTNEQQFFSEISELLQAGRAVAYRAVNSVMVKTYWQIGRRIVEQEQHGKARADYGEYLIVNLSRYLTDCLGKGFTEANIRNIRQFYSRFSNFDQFTTHCVANLSWTHIQLIMRLDNEKERHYYLQEASSQNWSTRLLERNIKSGYYRRLLSTQDHEQSGFDDKQPSLDFIKDPYVLEFLDVPEDLRVQESLLESNIIEHLQKFLLELGKGFSFVARQMRVSTETSHFFAVRLHRELRKKGMTYLNRLNNTFNILKSLKYWVKLQKRGYAVPHFCNLTQYC